MKKQILKWAVCLMMVASMIMLPISTMAEGNLEKTKITGVKACDNNEAAGLKFTWKKVEGATGYQYRYNLFWTKDSKTSDYTKVTTTKRSAVITFQDNGTVKFQVRPYKVVDGKKVYGKWTTRKLSQKKVENIMN